MPGVEYYFIVSKNSSAGPEGEESITVFMHLSLLYLWGDGGEGDKGGIDFLPSKNVKIHPPGAWIDDQLRQNPLP